MKFDDIKKEISKLINKEHSSVKGSDSIYHYTDINAIQSILLNNEVWLTQRNFINDVFEMSYPNDVLLEAYNNVCGKTGNIKYDAFMSNIMPIFNERYIFSLSRESDLIGQWSYYGKQDGYSIEFRVKELLAYFKKLGLGYASGGVIYNRINQVKIFELLIKYCINLEDVIKTKSDKSEILNELIKANASIIMFHSVFKQENNHCEKEYRISIASKINKYFRPRNGVMIPYIKAKIENDELPIKSIMVGPRIKDVVAENGMNQYIDSLKRKNLINVTTSKLSIR
jgi:hypothetical protein